MRTVNTLFQLGKAARVAIDSMPLCIDSVIIEHAATAQDLVYVAGVVEWKTAHKVSARFKARLRRAASHGLSMT